MTIQETFAAAIRLPERVAIYVPGTSGPAAADPAAADRVTRRTAAELAEIFGGSTVTSASGAWISDVHGLIMEDVRIVYAFGLAEQMNAHAPEILRIVETIKTEMQQEAVSVEIAGALYLV